jgi:DUF1680 family protein
MRVFSQNPSRTSFLVIFGLAGLLSCSRSHPDFPITPVAIDRVHLSDSFWAPRIQKDIDVTIPAVIGKLYETGRVKNFLQAAEVNEGESRSAEFCTAFPFDDSDVYKLIEAGAYALMNLEGDPRAPGLEARIDSLVGIVGRAQERDGYLYTARTMNPVNLPDMSGRERFVNEEENSHELYNLGHLYEAACTWYRATGKRDLLDIATRSADYLCGIFGKDKLVRYPGHEEIETGLARLYRTTGNRRYLDLANFFLEVRGPGGEEYNQANIKPIDQTVAVGHAVRAMYLYSGMTEVGVLDPDTAYLSTVKKVWQDIVASKTYVTGGIGSESSNEGFGKPYDLPNQTAYCETCSSIGLVLWNERMFRATGESRYIDLMEKTLYNAFLSGISLSGDHFFYPNPLESWGKKSRPDWYACACCPPNVARLIPRIPGFQYATRDDQIYVNLYAAGTASIPLKNKFVEIRQETRYPWDGKIRLTVNPGKPAQFALLLRIPGWSENEAFPSDLYRFQNQSGEPRVTGPDRNTGMDFRQGYIIIRRKWKNGDQVTIDLPMPVRRVEADSRIAADRGKVAIQRGPIIYCAEAADNTGSVLTVAIDSTTKFSGSFNPDLLNGVYSLTGTVSQYNQIPKQAKPGLSATGNAGLASETTRLTLIPYFSWANRTPGEMAVWFATAPNFITRFPSPPGLEAQAHGSASYAYDNSVPYLNDGIDPVNSADRSNNAFRMHPHKGTNEWVAYEFDQPHRVSSVKVYWLEDGSYVLPLSWRLSYQKSDGSWVPVNNYSPFSIDKDQYNDVAFAPVTTKGLRIDMQLSDKAPGGIIEWKVE